jgi:hypothetical protein
MDRKDLYNRKIEPFPYSNTQSIDTSPPVYTGLIDRMGDLGRSMKNYIYKCEYII